MALSDAVGFETELFGQLGLLENVLELLLGREALAIDGVGHIHHQAEQGEFHRVSLKLRRLQAQSRSRAPPFRAS